MKTRSRAHHGHQDHLQSALRENGTGNALGLSATRLKREGFPEPQSPRNSSVVPGVSDPPNAPNRYCLLSDTSEAQSIAPTLFVLTDSLHRQVTVSHCHPSLTGVMADKQPQGQDSADSGSPGGKAVRVSVQDVPYSSPDKPTSPVQVTELVSSAVCKAGSLPSDKNHNLPTMYVTSSESLHFPDSNRYGAETDGKLTCYPDVPVGGHSGFGTVFYYQELNEGKKPDVLNATQYSASSGSSYLYPKDGLHPSSQYTFAGQGCKTYNFTSTTGTSREYSPPAMTTYSSTGSTVYTPPLTTCLTSAGSPDSVHWSPDNGHVLPPDLRMPKRASSHPAPLQSEAMEQTGKRVSDSHRSAPSAYYSDDQSTGEDSMRDIEQDILKSDIHGHIYQNCSASLTICHSDKGSHAHAENLTPERRSAQSRVSSVSKKRRRRTQTPVQRKAANIRERKRMCHLNVAFNSLKDRLPNVRNRKKLSRIQTLKAAIFYISLLTECLQSS